MLEQVSQTIGTVVNVGGYVWQSEPGYEHLARVLRMAHDQAALGKGRVRHSNGLAFTDQPMLTINRTLGSIDGMLFQASKKAAEARGLPTQEQAIAELLGAINYLAGAVLLVEEGIIKSQAKK